MNNSKRQTITSITSITLDGFRILAALTVLVDHACMQWLTAYPATIKLLGEAAHSAVIIFFVLSGYLIAYTTTSNNRGPGQYAVARLSRLYSIALPAILLTISIECIVTIIDPSLAELYTRGYSWVRYILCIFFSNEVGLISASPPINGSLWSLSFEFWYYTVFGLWFYRTGWKSSLLIILACVVSGPKILLLMPVWLFGFLAYRVPKPVFSFTKSFSIFFIVLGVTGLAAVYLPQLPYELGIKPFYFANRFVTDWIISLLFSLSIWFLPANDYTVKRTYVNAIRAIADLSFPLYVLHYPLFVLWKAVFGWEYNNIVQLGIVTVIVGLISVSIGVFLENKRTVWVDFFKRLVDYVKPKLDHKQNEQLNYR